MSVDWDDMVAEGIGLALEQGVDREEIEATVKRVMTDVLDADEDPDAGL